MTPLVEVLRIRLQHELRMRSWASKFEREAVRLAREAIRENGGEYDFTTHRRLMDRIDRLMARYYANHPDDLNGLIVTDVIEPDARTIAPLAERRLRGTL